MKMKNSTSLTVGLLTVLIAFGIFDALLIENGRLLTQLDPPITPPNSTISDDVDASTGSSLQQGTRKMGGPNVLEILTAEKLSFMDSKRERSLIEQVIPSDIASIESKVLVQDGDRVGLIAWTESPEVKIYFLALKEALHSTFSPQMKDLVDEVQEREGRPPRNLLTFLDPTINSERVVFIRIRERLYEFHISEEKDDIIYDLIESLTN